METPSFWACTRCGTPSTRCPVSFSRLLQRTGGTASLVNTLNVPIPAMEQDCSPNPLRWWKTSPIFGVSIMWGSLYRNGLVRRRRSQDKEYGTTNQRDDTGGCRFGAIMSLLEPLAAISQQTLVKIVADGNPFILGLDTMRNATVSRQPNALLTYHRREQRLQTRCKVGAPER